MISPNFINLVCRILAGEVRLPKLYIGYSYTDPASNAGVTEPTDGNYRRQLLTGKMGALDSAITNTKPLVFPRCTVQLSESIKYFIVYDALTGGNLLMAAKLKHPKVLTIDEALLLQPKELVIDVYGE